MRWTEAVIINRDSRDRLRPFYPAQTLASRLSARSTFDVIPLGGIVPREYCPTTLPDIDAVELVDLRRIEANRVSQYMLCAKTLPGIECGSDSVVAIVSAWRMLTSGESARCHAPPVGFRFFIDGKIVLEASVCWRCNNLYGFESGAEIFYAFDAESEAAKKLLTLAKSLIGNEVVGDG